MEPMFTDSLAYEDSDSDGSNQQEYTVINTEDGYNYIHAPNLRNIQIGDGRITVVTGGESRRSHQPSHKQKSQPDRHKDQNKDTHCYEEMKELTDSAAQRSTNDLNHICSNLGKSWKKLGRALGLSKSAIETIELDYRVEGVYEMTWQTILKWRRQKADGGKLRDLARALDEIGLRTLAREIPVE